MATLVFDIETAPLPGELFLPSSEGEQDTRGLSSLTGQIVAIGVYDLDREQGAVYYQGDGSGTETYYEGFVLKERNERTMLEDFWTGSRDYNVFVSFAGRGFDVPFINIRSAVHNIPLAKDLMEHRYLLRQKTVFHVDLQDQISYYGAVSKKPSLKACCGTFGIESSKDSGVTGKDITELFLKEKFRDIAEYNARDVIATTQLYKKWHTYLAPPAFRNLDL